METKIKNLFIEKWRKYFNDYELPVTFWYSNEFDNAEKVPASDKWKCMICELSKVRKGRSLAFGSDAITCGGAQRYLGFTNTMMPEFKYFLSCGIKGIMKGERYIRTPEMVNELMKNQKKFPLPGKNIVFKRWDMLVESDDPAVVIFFATPDVLSGLFTLANFDQSEPNSTFTPFGAGCGSVIHYPYLEKDNERPRAVIGMFDPSARPCVSAEELTFAVPMVKFLKMISYMDESFLITDSWKKVQKRIK
ncbi:MAG: DUF169 domain-containing protein [Bacteroidales bacterium]